MNLVIYYFIKGGCIMSKLLNVLLSIIVGAFFLTGCGKLPTQQINDAKAQVEAATNTETQTYAPVELTKLNSDLEAALNLVKIQQDMWLSRYGKAIEMLTAIKVSSENVKAVAAQNKEKAKNKAIAAQTDAKDAVEAAQALLTKATGKVTKAYIKAFKDSLTGLQGSLPEIQQSIGEEKYIEAANTANAIKVKASNISKQFQRGLDKAKSKK
jgi:hypothetical protein